ncbi:MAG: DUF4097 domain-containing protein [Clostridiales bacterium]|nr:DUF4097 domain-containing protein [Clostridiales bacterium]
MRKIVLIPLIIVIVGLCLALAGFATGGLKGLSFDRGGVHMNSVDRGELITVNETYKSFKNIEVDADYISRVTFKEGDGYAVKGENYERYGGLTVNLKGDTLMVNAKRDAKWSINIGLEELWDSEKTYLEITYPKGAEFGDVKLDISVSKVAAAGIKCGNLYIRNDFGSINVSGATCGDMTLRAASGAVTLAGAAVEGTCDIRSDFGNVEVKGVNAKTLTAELSSGSLEAHDIGAGTLKVSCDFGKATIDGAEADDMTLKLASGDLKGDNITTGGLTVTNEFGKTTLDRLLFTGRCEIDASSGSVGLKLLVAEDDLSYDLEASAGSVHVDGEKFSGSVRNRAPEAPASLTIRCDFGSINVDFLK